MQIFSYFGIHFFQLLAVNGLLKILKSNVYISVSTHAFKDGRVGGGGGYEFVKHSQARV